MQFEFECRNLTFVLYSVFAVAYNRLQIEFEYNKNFRLRSGKFIVSNKCCLKLK